MTPAAFESSTTLITLDGKRLSHAELSIAFRCSHRMVQRYLYGEVEIPRDTADHLAYMLRHGLLPEVAKAIRERRAKDGRMRQATRQRDARSMKLQSHMTNMVE
jgi:hypothetical protein